MPPLGCVPLQRTVAGGSERKCVEEYNNATVLFNDKLSNEIDSIKTNLSDNKIVYMDIYSRILDVIVNRQNYGNYKFQNFNFIYILTIFLTLTTLLIKY